MRKANKSMPPVGNVTIKHVAQYLDISHSTVSRALNDHPYTNAETKRKVRQAVERLGYVPNSAARTLRRDTGSLVGLVLPDIQNELFAAAAQTLAQRCLKAGLQLVLSITEDDPLVEYNHVKALREARAVGIIITPSAEILDKTIALLASVPVVQYSRRSPRLSAPSASIDGDFGLFTATTHLLQLGHRRVAYIGAERDKSTGAERIAGYARAHKQFNQRLDPRLQYLGPTHQDFGHAAVSELLRRTEAPTAFVLGSGAIMPGALRGFRNARLKIPADISLVGFGDPPWYAEWGNGITTVGVPLQDLAEAAASQLMRQLQPAAEVTENIPGNIALEPFLLLRGTTEARVALATIDSRRRTIR